ncbi:MAG: ATP-binding cassette domain-containing protein [Propionibacteriaceae bacterium]|nr:ATP-binding cassette domain-containing protein [Propionibacteriaceae bacterium]
MAAIFGDDDGSQRPPDPFEEKILTGRNAFNDLRDQLAEEGQAPPDSSAARPSRGALGGEARDRIADLRRDLESGTSTRRPSAASAADRRAAAPEAPPASTDDRIAALRRDLATRRPSPDSDEAQPAPAPRTPAERPVRPRPPSSEQRGPSERVTTRTVRPGQTMPRPVDDEAEPGEAPAAPRSRRAPSSRPGEASGPAFVAPEDAEAPQAAPIEKAPPARDPEKRRPAAKTPGKPKPATGEVIQATGLTMEYGSSTAAAQALRGVDMIVGRGQMTAIMGRSGSGKSTLLRCLAAMEIPTQGSVVLDGKNLAGLKDKQLDKIRRESVGLIFAEDNLLPMLSTAENIRLPLTIHKAPVDQSWYDEVVTTLHLSDTLTRKPSELTPNQQQRVACARAMIAKPAVVFADEPTRMLDSDSAAEFLDLLRRCVDELGQTVVIATHDPYAASQADRVCVIQDGCIVNEVHGPSLNKMIDIMRTLSGGSAS